MRYGPSGQYRGGMVNNVQGGMVSGRGGISKPRSMRGFRDATGQLIVDHDDGMDNLSDKELYARNIPAIGSCVLVVAVSKSPPPPPYLALFNSTSRAVMS